MVAYIDIYNTPLNQARRKYYTFLYELLGERKPWQNISHKKMPSYKKHKAFVKSKPYKSWYVIKEGEYYIGSVYLGKQNNIGIFIKDNFRHQGYGKKAIEFIYEKFPHVRLMYAHIAPTNQPSMCFFLNNGFKHHGYTKENDKIIEYLYVKLNPYYVDESH